MGSKPMMYKLTRGNLALSFCQMLNLNIFYEAPRLNLIQYYSNIVLKTILELLENAKALMPKWSRKTETSLRMDYAEIKARDGAKV